MAKLTDQATYKCGLAAIQSAQSIEGVLPILHAGPGCSGKLAGFDFGTSGHFSSSIFPCSNLLEAEIVFGGEQRLRDTIENALKIIDADLYAVFTSCASEIIGDDSEEIANEFRKAGKPVIHVSTAGFKGNNYLGHEWLLASIFDQYLPAAKPHTIEKGLVNVFASLPLHDPFWAGNYDALEGLLAEIGLKANIIFGYGRGLKNVDRIPKAEFNLVVNPWLGLDSVRLLEEKYGAPWFHWPSLPIGPDETGRFLQALTAFAGLDKGKTQNLIDAKEKKYYYYIERFANTFLETRIMSKRFSVVSDSQNALAYTRFLVNDLGVNPLTQYATENVPEHHRDAVRGYFKDLNYGLEAEVSFETDGYLIHEEIKKADYLGYPLIIGSTWEKELEEELGAHYLVASWPVTERLIINGSYVGYDGALRFIEDIYSVVLRRFL
ncbi:MAG: hydrogenase [Peptococcaceae bacterium]|jgi:nitrogenase molybdenum-iron protein beta chain|nr:hydrogenase [Peptococcaceae bacterium]